MPCPCTVTLESLVCALQQGTRAGSSGLRGKVSLKRSQVVPELPKKERDESENKKKHRKREEDSKSTKHSTVRLPSSSCGSGRLPPCEWPASETLFAERS